MHRRHLLCLAAWPLAQPGMAWALTQPEGPVVISVSGAPGPGRPPSQALFDMAMLERLPHRSYSALTPWYGKPHKFSGPLLRSVLAAAGVQGNTLRVKALNDYQVTIPMADLNTYQVLLARLLDDQPLTVRDKGPLFIIYPFDQHPELRNTVHYSRCAWQLSAIEVT